MKVGDKVKIPTKKSINCPLEICKALQSAKQFNQDYLVVCLINGHKIIIGPNTKIHDSVFLDTDLELYETPKPIPFRIIGKLHQLNSIIEDLVEIGYKKDPEWDKHKQCGITFNSSRKNILDNIDNFKKLIRIIYYDKKEKTFNLPEQYSEVLQFAKEQLEHIYWKTIKQITEVKKGDYLYCIKEVKMSNIHGTIEAIPNKTYYCPLNNEYLNESGDFHNLGKIEWTNEYFRRATPKEVIQYEKEQEIKISGYKAEFDNKTKTVSLGCKKDITWYELIKVEEMRKLCLKYDTTLQFTDRGQILYCNENISLKMDKLIKKLSS